MQVRFLKAKAAQRVFNLIEEKKHELAEKVAEFDKYHFTDVHEMMSAVDDKAEILQVTFNTVIFKLKNEIYFYDSCRGIVHWGIEKAESGAFGYFLNPITNEVSSRYFVAVHRRVEDGVNYFDLTTIDFNPTSKIYLKVFSKHNVFTNYDQVEVLAIAKDIYFLCSSSNEDGETHKAEIIKFVSDTANEVRQQIVAEFEYEERLSDFVHSENSVMAMYRIDCVCTPVIITPKVRRIFNASVGGNL